MKIAAVGRLGAVVAICVVAFAGTAAAQHFREDIVKTGTFDRDLFVSGEKVSIQAKVAGDVVAMGSDMVVHSQVDGDVLAMAGNLDLESTVGGDTMAMGGDVRVGGQLAGGATVMGGNVRVAGDIAGSAIVAGGDVRTIGKFQRDVKIMGGRIDQASSVGGNILVAGGWVTFAPSSTVAGKAWVTAGRAMLDGTVGGELRVAAKTVKIAGKVTGDVYIDAVDIEILPTAEIDGNVVYRSPREATIDPGARIAGDVTFNHSEMSRRIVGFAFAVAGLGGLAVIGGLVLLGAALLLAFPRATAAAARTIGASPWRSLGLGFAILAASPVLVAVLISTIIGIPLAVFVVALYVASVMAGFVVVAFALGRRIARLFRRAGDGGFWPRFGVLVLGVVVFTVIALIPFLGALALSVGVILGVGALTIEGFRVYAKAGS